MCWLPFVGDYRNFPGRSVFWNCGKCTARIMAFWYYGVMAVRKMTFSVQQPLADKFLRRVPSRDRSRFVSEALAARLEERDVQLLRACEAANQDLEATQIEKEFDGIRDEMAEPWK